MTWLLTNKETKESFRKKLKYLRIKKSYLLHRTVIRESAKTIKMITVYDASAKPSKEAVSRKNVWKVFSHYRIQGGIFL